MRQGPAQCLRQGLLGASLEAPVPQAQPGNLEGIVAEGRLQRHLGGGVAVGVGIADTPVRMDLAAALTWKPNVNASTLAFLIAVQRLPARDCDLPFL